MTEVEWDSSQDPRAMLAFLRETGKLTERKSRLFAWACCRRVWDTLYDIEKKAVAVAEKYFEGMAGEEERTIAFEEVKQKVLEVYGRDGPPVALDLLDRDAWDAVTAILLLLPEPPSSAISDIIEKRAWCGLLRDISGPLPFRPLTIAPAVLQWNGGTAARLAQAAYEQHSLPAGTMEPDRLAVLADALEEAGCQDQEVLMHLREPGGVHVRGCHVVDILLGKS
jgi:hypothetical protein